MHRVLALSLLAVAACTSAVDDDLVDDDLVAAALLAPLPDGQADFEQQIAFWCPGADRAAGVTSYRGLAGTYTRLGLPAAAEPYKLTFFPAIDHPDAAGLFTGREGTATGATRAYGGAFRAIGDNPAIGAALGLDVGGDGAIDQVFFVLALRRSSFGTLTGLCLAGHEHPFLLVRTFI